MVIKGFIETSFVDWDGKICSVIFLPGCNFKCVFCHNHKLVFNYKDLPDISWNEIKKKLLHHKGWVDGVCISGGEPLMDPDLLSVIEEIRDLDLLVKLDTNGSFPDLLKNLFKKKLINYVAMDIKAPLDERYGRITQVKVDLSKIRESIKLILKSRIDYEFRTTMVPGYLGKDELVAIAKEIKGAKKFILQNFNPKDTLCDNLKDVQPYTDKEMDGFKRAIEKYVEFSKVR
ncbi:MAG: anaerobic ribonucleoside-triphosphate reductase activating protein [bacterium]|nr:anaerobic ribonucleoside-triphosphate reductase activating protein [bacterium]